MVNLRRHRACLAGLLAVLWLAAAPEAHAQEPGLAVLPSTAEGLGPDMLGLVDSMIAEKAAGLEWSPIPAKDQATQCTTPECTTEAPAIGMAVGADKVLATHMVRDGEQVTIRMLVHDVVTGSTQESIAETTRSGLLAQVVKLLKKALGKPAPAVEEVAEPEPEPAVVSPPLPKLFTPKDAYDLSKEMCKEKLQPNQEVRLYHCMWESNYRNAMILIVTGGVATAIGASFTIASGVLWKQFDDWKDRQDSDCTDCIAKSVKKLKLNAAITALAIAQIVPGAIALFTGLIKRYRILKLRKELTGFIPEMTLALPHSLDRGEITLTWRF